MCQSGLGDNIYSLAQRRVQHNVYATIVFVYMFYKSPETMCDLGTIIRWNHMFSRRYQYGDDYHKHRKIFMEQKECFLIPSI